MNILITGSGGFLGREFSEFFFDHNLIFGNRKNLDLCDKSIVDDFFDTNEVDVILHTAIQGRGNNQIETYEMLCNNLLMFNNLNNNCDRFKLMINFGSGAEFDRKLIIDRMKEEDVFDRFPQDYYGMAKRIITSEIHKSNNVFNMRIFACFGFHESKDRFIKASLYRLLNNKPILIYDNRLMDFFFVEDLCRVVEFYINENIKKLYKDLNICYHRKQTLFDIAHMICGVVGVPPSTNIQIQSGKKVEKTAYTGNGDRLESLGIDFFGLERGIEKVYERIR